MMCKVKTHLVVMLAIVSLQLRGAQNAVRPQFEVASVKRNIDGGAASSGQAPGGRLIVRNNGLLNLILNAYSIWPYQLANKPAWMDDEHYDVDAKAGDPNTTHAELMLMLQALLEDRFKLRVHREDRDLPVFVLSAAKGGIKVHPSTARCTRVEPNTSVRPPGLDEPPLCGNRLTGNRETMQWHAQNIDVSQLLELLGSFLGRKVMDKTEFNGRFDVDLEFARDVASTDATKPSLVTVLQDELGFKLDSARGSVDVLVIDHVERPSEN